MKAPPILLGAALPWLFSGLAIVLTILFGHAWLWFLLVAVCSLLFVR
jgi:hypothetical protein